MKFSQDWVFGLAGAGGFAREIMPIVRDNLTEKFRLSRASDLDGHICFVETKPTNSALNGVPVVSEDEFLSFQSERLMFNVAIADSQVRQEISERWINEQISPFSLRSRTADVGDSNEIASGSILAGNSTITANTRIGCFFHSNIYSYVAHDCFIGDYVTFAPNVQCNGNVRIEDHAYIGTGAIIRQGSPESPLVIGARAVIGMGAVVTKDIPPNVTVIGAPARPL